ncbi:TadE/TadG family type IV pilus assembly protein [Nocardiopsis lambiniae]|uniref:TadE/TadG family type IV pilus assembly protein n=1 Tax=Nocardiopsis lambiniae TaxID=3075539 RepID=A0ABU2MER2_9ACTN|nr:TadE/TadG family type IV pilus assembly protein [Nocardiopsis sp. DSM 44743]MDT0331184.1 TadE/TadG family type IV pilus assembly protein [Nocardiopsis sp. DSM 44743]
MRQLRDDRGSTEMAIAAPALLLLVMLVVQAALWMHGDHVAADLARRTAEQSRTVDGGSTPVGPPAGSVLTDVNVAVDRGAEEVRVTVTGHVPSVIPGLSWPVEHVSVAPVERYVPGGEAP